MIYQTMKVVIVAAMLAVCGNVSAQNCASCSGGGVIDYGYTQNVDADKHRCGRGITQARAAKLWAGYCNESCEDNKRCRGRCGRGCFGGRGGDCGCAMATDCGMVTDCGSGCGGCKLGGKLRGKFGGGCGGASGCGCGGCDSGLFGYPEACGCGCDTGRCFGGKLFGGRMGKRDACGGCGCGCGGGLFGGLFGHGCKDRCRGGLFAKSRQQCGTSCAYFDEAVGYEYGNAGMQSCVTGMATEGEMVAGSDSGAATTENINHDTGTETGSTPHPDESK